jgi:enamine deaminase RidA (YjgF/YER057c/UK114 family)
VKPEDRLQELDVVLPAAPDPLGAYVLAVQSVGFLFVSGMLPVAKQQPVWTGQLGRELGVAEGRNAAKLAALNGLAVARAASSGPTNGLHFCDSRLRGACEGC